MNKGLEGRPQPLKSNSLNEIWEQEWHYGEPQKHSANHSVWQIKRYWRNGWYRHLVWTLKVNFWVLPSKNGSTLNNALFKSLFLFISKCDRQIKARQGALSLSKVILWMRYESENDIMVEPKKQKRVVSSPTSGHGLAKNFNYQFTCLPNIWLLAASL